MGDISVLMQEERARCRALIEALPSEVKFLLFCIDNAYCVSDIDTARQRFKEFGLDKPFDEFEELM
jgi:superfamily II DNA helicase RecQ